MEDGKIRTQFDDLISSLQYSVGTPMSVSRLAEICNASSKSILEWSHILEREGKVELINRLDGVYVSWIEKHEKGKSPVAYEETTPSFEQEIAIAREREQKMKAPHPIPASKGKIATIEKIAEAREEMSALDSELSRVESAIEQLERLSAKAEDIAELHKLEQGEQKEAHWEAPEADESKAPEKQTEETQQAAETPQQETEIETPEPEEKEISPSQESKAAEQEKPLMQTTLSGGLLAQKPSEERKSRFAKVKKPEPVQVTEVSLKFSERMQRQLHKIEAAAREVEALRAEKEQLLNEQYLPMQRRLESEIETINDRIVRVENGIFSVQKRASDLPAKVGAVEKLQHSTINAHEQMRKAYDEASALIEQSSIQLADELSRMEEFAEQCRSEIAGHSAKTTELSKTLERINQYEGDLAYQVSVAREAMAQQAERLASAEKYASELESLREEIRENVVGIKREMGASKAMLTDIENQMEQVRKIQNWAVSIKDDYESKMQEIDDYIKNGNSEFETLRDSVEARFVRKYLRELRTLSESYTFELNSVRGAEKSIDEKTAEARKKLSELIESGQKLAYEYETAAKTPEGASGFRSREEIFDELPQLEQKRTQIEEMIAQVVGKKTEYEPAAAQQQTRAHTSHKAKHRKARSRKGRR